jgi:hypothetical protein
MMIRSLSVLLLVAGPLQGGVTAAAPVSSDALSRPAPGAEGADDLEPAVAAAAGRHYRATFRPSGTAGDPDLVRLVKSRKSRAGDSLTVSVVIGGPSSTADLYAFAFDLKLDGAPVEYVPGSAVAGNALRPESGQGVVVEAKQVGDRIIVGVSMKGGGTGSSIPGNEATIVSLALRPLSRGVTTITFEGPPAPFANGDSLVQAPAALDSNGSVLAAVHFDAGASYLVSLKE